MNLRRSALACCAFTLTLCGSALDARAAGAAPDAFKSAVQPFIEAHCVECHDAETEKGGVRLDNLAADFSKHETAAVWTEVFDQVSTGAMPPKKKARPPEADQAKVLAYLKGGLTAADQAARKTEGRVVLRRLNRVEYENTVRDLLGVEVDLKELLPEDGMALGFDNVASALNVSSVLMERYLEAADVALEAAIDTGPRPETKNYDVPAGPNTKNPEDYRLKSGVKVLPDRGFVWFNSSGETPIVCDHFRAPVEGRYKFRVPAYAYQSDRPLTMLILAGAFDAKNPKKTTIGFFDVPPDAKNPRVIEFTQYLPKSGSIKVMPFETGKRGIRSNAATYDGPGVCVLPFQVEGPLFESWPAPSHKRLFGELDFYKASDADIEPILAKFAERAFRRPVTKDEVEPYAALVRERLKEIAANTPPADPKKPRRRQPGELLPFDEAIRVGLKGILCSPDFLFLREPSAGRLDAYAVASRLSFFFWSTAPDAELLKLAADKSLLRPDILRAQTERLLRDPRARAFTENFTGQWLGLRQIEFTTPDTKLYPEFDAQLQWSMLGETRAFFDEVLGKDLSLLSFVDSDFTFLNGRLARHYGIPGVSGNDLRRVQLPPDSHRGGVLAHASVLKVTANGTTTSPIVRGAWVVRNILGQTLKPPPPNVPAVEPDIRGAHSIREQLAKHREVGACASCHVKMDPPGNALESFDVIGGFRDGYRIIGDPKSKTQIGTWPNVYVNEYRVGYRIGPKVEVADKLADGREFQTFEQFKQLLLADRDQVTRCLTEKLVVYSTGGGLGFADREAVNELVRKSGANGYKFRSLVHDVVQSPLFLSK